MDEVSADAAHSSLLNELYVDPKVRAEQKRHTIDVNENVYTRASVKPREAVNQLEAALTINQVEPTGVNLLTNCCQRSLIVDSHAGSIARALAVLEFLDTSQRGWNISELSRKLDVPKSTMHLILSTLERLGYVSREPGSRDYTLSVKVYELGRSLMRNVMLPDNALPHLEDLVRKVRLTAHLLFSSTIRPSTFRRWIVRA